MKSKSELDQQINLINTNNSISNLACSQAQKIINKNYSWQCFDKRQQQFYSQQFQCSICYLPFDVYIKLPIMICLSQHTYCQQCLYLMIIKQKQSINLSQQPMDERNIVQNQFIRINQSQYRLDQIQIKCPICQQECLIKDNCRFNKLIVSYLLLSQMIEINQKQMKQTKLPQQEKQQFQTHLQMIKMIRYDSSIFNQRKELQNYMKKLPQQRQLMLFKNYEKQNCKSSKKLQKQPQISVQIAFVIIILILLIIYTLVIQY